MSKRKNLQYQNNFNDAVMGQNGIRILTTGQTSPTGETYVAVQALKNSVISASLNANSVTGEIGDDSITNLELDQFGCIPTSMHNVVVTSGIVCCYKG